MDWLKRHITSASLSLATAIIGLQLIVPGIFDFIFDLILLGLIALVARMAQRP